jgi:hypothetical protein
VQVPGAVAEEQVSQAPSHALEQQTPSTQKPEAHSDALEQAMPALCVGTHCPFTQLKPVAQPLSAVQLVGQLVSVPLQSSGAQSPSVGALPAARG